MAEYIPSHEQAAFFDWIETKYGNLVLEAGAGCGKSTTLIKGIPLMRGTIGLMAFNREAAADLKAKAAEDGIASKRLFISTCHGMGMSNWKRAAPGVEVVEHKVRNLIDKYVERGDYNEELSPFISKIVSLAKQLLLPRISDETAIPQAWYDAVEHFAMEELLGEYSLDDAIRYAGAIHLESRALCHKIIDYDDMIYAPLAFNAKIFQNDWVVCDEWQDSNPARRLLAKKMLKPRFGRLVAVGDEYQAIYGFCHPAGTPVMTPSGWSNIEDLVEGDAVIVSPTDGQIQGWRGTKKVLETHTYQHSGLMITLRAGEHSVSMTPHHRVPVKIDTEAKFYTYLMRRRSTYRVGYCAANTTERFMFSQRCVTEGADEGWLLGSFETREAAILAENMLLQEISGKTWNQMSDEEVDRLAANENDALVILARHGRMADFPLWVKGKRQHFEANLPFVTEACNIMDGMRVAFYSKDQAVGGKKGRRQNFIWTPCEISSKHFSGMVYGITVDPANVRKGYAQHPLYFAGTGILVHNTGASSDALAITIKEHNADRLPLSITYRCPKAAVEYVQRWIPPGHLTAHPSAPQGVIRGLAPRPAVDPAATTPQRALRWFEWDTPSSADAILCRYNQPLVSTAFGMIRAGIPCKIEGRDIGNGLVQLAQRWKVRTLDGLETRLQSHLERGLKKAALKRSESAAQELQDKVNCLRLFIERCREKGSNSIECVVAEIRTLFEDGVKGVTTLSSGHKAKGREWNRIWWIQIGENGRPMQDWEYRQEDNLNYVIGTRWKQEMVLVPDDTRLPRAK